MSHRCEGLPNGACPENRCDKTVKFGICDLFLCPACEKARAAEHSTTTAELREVSKKLNKQSTKKSAGGICDTSSSNTTVAASQAAPKTALSDVTGTAASDVGATSLPSTVASASSGSSQHSEIVVNELLTYVSFYRNQANPNALRRTVLSFYSPEDISQGKKIIIHKFQSFLKSCSLLSDRRNSSSRPAQEAEVDDIIGIFDILDQLDGVLSGVSFVAANLDSLPKFGPEELNLAAVVDRQVRTDSAIKDLSTTVQQLAATHAGSTPPDLSAHCTIQAATADIQQKLDSFTTSVFARLDHLSAVCTSSLRNSTSQQDLVAQQSDNFDRRLNIVLFGVPEERDVSVWRRKVDDMLHFITDHNIDVVDAFRLGRYNPNGPNKPRPILLKLRTVWDKRLILSRCSRLKQYSQRGVFVAADEPPEVRRREMYRKLKYRAVKDNKMVDEKDGVLLIDNIAVYSLSQGYINRVINSDSHG
jgi:hypothetical protein